MAKGEYFVVLNNDVEVPPSWLTTMGACFSDPKVAVVGTKGQCSALTKEGVGCPGTVVEYIEGSCLMTPVSLARKHGLFLDIYRFAYNEDADYSLRMREAGYLISQADVKLLHHGSKTSELVKKTVDLDGYKARNAAIFKNQWKNYLERRSFSKTVLIRRTSATGDVLLVTPIFRSLRKKWPDVKISLITGFPDIVTRNPNIDRLENGFRLPITNYDHFYDLDFAYERRPMIHIVKAYAEACDVKLDSYIPEVFPTSDDDRWADATVPRGRPILIINPGPTAWVGRNWTNVKFAEVVNYWRKKGYFTVLTGFILNNSVPCDLDLRNRTTMHQLACLMRRASLYIGIDSFPMHLAVAADLPIAAVFGCIDPAYRLPPDTPYFRGVMAENVGCLGCNHYLQAPRVTTGCFRDKVYCMDKLEPAQVISESETSVREYQLKGISPRRFYT
jgi:ADP-heptose:LPS heptosyltransferase